MSDLLPHNATPFEHALEDSAARITDIPVPVSGMFSADDCPAHLLAWLAWALSVDSWNDRWTESQKRGAIAAAAAVHNKKGTLGGLKHALSGIGYDTVIKEWFESIPHADPYTFFTTVIVDQEPIPDNGIYMSVIDTIENAKNARSHFTGLEIEGRSAGAMNIGMVYHTGEEVSVFAE